MYDPLLHIVKNFLKPRLLPRKPLLLGFSGGPDSKALLYSLLDCRRFFPFVLHVAHIDHGWRPGSSREAAELGKEVEGLGLAWHLKTVPNGTFQGGNLEHQGRCIRNEFFFELHKKLDCQAILLGHQADDQAEVVAKRIFEGAHLSSLGGLSEESSIGGAAIWRPLLAVNKKEILDWLEQKEISYFVDSTNLDPHFLRGRMRAQLFPSLSETFGKEVAKNLCFLGEQARELKGYFAHLNAPLLRQVVIEEKKESLDLSKNLPLPSLQLKYLLKEWFSNKGSTPSRQIIDGIVEALLQQEGEKRFCFKRLVVCVKSGIVFILNKK